MPSGGKWKTVILWNLKDGKVRFNKLMSDIPDISPKMLTKQLRELERDGIVERKMFPEIPPSVEYSLTPLAISLVPILSQMAQWGMGPAIAPNQWNCYELAFIGDQPQHLLYAWIDGTLVHSITAPDQWSNGNMPMNWLNGKFVEVIFGWQSFSGATNDVWMDDIALATERIGCN